MENIQPSNGATLRSVAIIATAVLIASALAVSSYFISNSLRDMKKTDNIISVKGQAEKIVQSNEAKLVIQFEIAAASVEDFSSAVSCAQTEIQQYLVAQGFKETEIKRGDMQMKDMLAQEVAGNRKGARFVGSGEISVESDNVELMGSTKDSVAQLMEKGIAVSGSSLKYYFTDLESIKSDMLKEATTNARTVAASFAENSGVKIKTMQSASQDAFEINEPADEHYSGAAKGPGGSSLSKKVRVIVNVDFATSE